MSISDFSDLYSFLLTHDLFFSLANFCCLFECCVCCCCCISAVLRSLVVVSRYEAFIDYYTATFCTGRCHSAVTLLLTLWGIQQMPLAAVGPDFAHSLSLAVSGFARSGGRTEKSRAGWSPWQHHAHTPLRFTSVQCQ